MLLPSLAFLRVLRDAKNCFTAFCFSHGSEIRDGQIVSKEHPFLRRTRKKLQSGDSLLKQHLPEAIQQMKTFFLHRSPVTL